MNRRDQDTLGNFLPFLPHNRAVFGYHPETNRARIVTIFSSEPEDISDSSLYALKNRVMGTMLKSIAERSREPVSWYRVAEVAHNFGISTITADMTISQKIARRSLEDQKLELMIRPADDIDSIDRAVLPAVLDCVTMLKESLMTDLFEENFEIDGNDHEKAKKLRRYILRQGTHLYYGYRAEKAQAKSNLLKFMENDPTGFYARYVHDILRSVDLPHTDYDRVLDLSAKIIHAIAIDNPRRANKFNKRLKSTLSQRS